MTYRINVRTQPSPVKIHVQYRDVSNKGPRKDLKVYTSTHTKEPREGNF